MQTIGSWTGERENACRQRKDCFRARNGLRQSRRANVSLYTVVIPFEQARLPLKRRKVITRFCESLKRNFVWNSLCYERIESDDWWMFCHPQPGMIRKQDCSTLILSIDKVSFDPRGTSLCLSVLHINMKQQENLAMVGVMNPIHTHTSNYKGYTHPYKY